MARVPLPVIRPSSQFFAGRMLTKPRSGTGREAAFAERVLINVRVAIQAAWESFVFMERRCGGPVANQLPSGTFVRLKYTPHGVSVILLRRQPHPSRKTIHMKTPPSIFNDVIGPVMRGPSSSHCAAALRIGRLARDLMDGDV
jgi:hypothetical protein